MVTSYWPKLKCWKYLLVKNQHNYIKKSAWRHHKHLLHTERNKYSHSGCAPGEAQARCWGKVRHSGRIGPDWQPTPNSDAAPPHLRQNTSKSFIFNDTINTCHKAFSYRTLINDDDEEEADRSRVSSAERGRHSSWLEDTGSFHQPSLMLPAPSSLGVGQWTQALHKVRALVGNRDTFLVDSIR